MTRWLFPGSMVIAVVAGCGAGDESQGLDRVDGLEVHVGAALDAAGEGTVHLTLDPPGAAHIAVHLDGAARILEIDVVGGESAALEGASGETYVGGVWLRPVPYDDGVLALEVGEGAREVTIAVRGAPV